MGAAGANAPIIIKRKKVVSGGGHHGGAWKVAYADFVTAMMAFFMLLWLLNATTEQQRKGIADYFSPTLPIMRISGGGDGMFGGDNIFAEQTLAQNGTGASRMVSGANAIDFESDDTESTAPSAADVATFDAVQDVLIGQGGESLISDKALQHVITRLTDEGLIIELFDLNDAHLFEPDTTNATAPAIELAAVLARIFGSLPNEVAVVGHTKSRPIVLRDNPVWDLSSGRASVFRALLQGKGLGQTRFRRVTGHADRALATRDPFADRNNRIEVILLRSDI